MGKRKIFGILLALVMILSVVVMPGDMVLAADDSNQPVVIAETEETDPVDETKHTGQDVITIIHTNDVHGYVVEDEDAGKLGYAKLKTFVDSKPNALLLDAGDVLHGTTFATISKGQSMIELMNEVGYDAMTPGNHDYNYGAKRLLELQEIADFPILQANVVNQRGQRTLEPYEIFEVDGVKVGVFGLATPETKTKSNPLNTQGLTFTEYIQEARFQVNALKDEGADVIIGLVHLGLDEASEVRADLLAQAVGEIDVLIDGHSHTVISEPMLVNGVLIASTGNHIENVGEITLVVDNGQVTLKNSRLHTYEQLKDLEPNAEILAEIERVQEENKPILEEVIGTAEVDLDGERENVRSGETNLGNLLTDAMLDISGADIALTNGGGIRASIAKGDITMDDVLKAFPFTNYPVVLEISGVKILEALEFGLDSAPEVVGKFPHVGGMTFKYDVNQPAGQRVFDVLVGDVPLDPSEVYELVTNDFMAVGGDGYEMLADGEVVSEHPLLSEVLVNYIKELETVNIEIEGRVTEGTKPVSDDVVFTDIDGHWAEEYILDGVSRDFFRGMTATTFEPNTNITRGMIVTTLHRLEGEPTATDPSSFPDVISEDWYGPAIAWASEHDIVLGYEDETFKPNQELTREEMATILSRYFINYKENSVIQVQAPDFADEASISQWADREVDIMVITGIMEGKPGNIFDPQGKATRAELSKVIFELYQTLYVENQAAA